MTWENKITGFDYMSPDQLTGNPRNARLHPNVQRDTLRAVMSDVGIVAPVIQNDLTGYLIDGHLRVEEAISAGLTQIPVIHVRLTPEEEAEMLAVFDPIAEMAKWDQQRLDELIEMIDTENGAILTLLNDLASSAGIVDTSAGAAKWDGSGDTPYAGVKSLVLVFEDDQYDKVAEWLEKLPGDTNSEKVFLLAEEGLLRNDDLASEYA